MKEMSRKKEVRLGDAAPDEHVIVFSRGEMVEIRCPKQLQSHVPKKKAAKSTARKGRSPQRGIPEEVKTDVAAIVEHFHTTAIRNLHCRYVPRYKGKFLYLDRQDYGWLHPICRLEYTGKMEE